MQQIYELIKSKQIQGKTIDPKPLVQLMPPQEFLQIDFTDHIQIDIWVLAIKYNKIKLTDNKIQGVLHQYLSQEKSPQTQRRIISILSQYDQIKAIEDYISIDGLNNNFIQPLYDCILNRNDETIKVSEELQILYKNLFILLQYKKLINHYPLILKHIINFITYDDAKFKDKSQEFSKQQFMKLRQLMFGWIVSKIQDIQEQLVQYIPSLFNEKQQQNTDFVLQDLELIKIVHFGYLGELESKEILKMDNFWRSFKGAFFVFGDLTNSKTCISLLKQILTLVKDKEFLKYYQLFSDLYVTLDSFGTHITKDVWQKLDPFLNVPNLNLDNPIKQHLFNSIKPIEILLSKAANHNNEKTIKNCIKILFKKQVDYDYLKDVIINLIMPLMNKALFYADSPLEGDSKFGELIKLFYTKIPYLDEIIIQFTKYMRYPLSIGAFSQLFIHINKPIQNQEIFPLLIVFLKENYQILNLRKRILLIKALITFLRFNKNPNYLIDFFQALPYQCINWYSSNEEWTIPQGIAELIQQIPQDELMDHLQKVIKNYDQDTLKIISIILCCTQNQNIHLLLGGLFSKFENIYVSTYEDKEIKQNNLELLNYQLLLSKDFQIEYQSYIVKCIINYYKLEISHLSSELFAYFQTDLESALKCVENIWSLSYELFDEANNLAQNMNKFLSNLFQRWFNKQDQFLILEILTRILKARNLQIFQAKLNKTAIYIEDLFLQYGLKVLQELQSSKLDRQSKGVYVHYLSHILTFFRETKHRTDEYLAQVSNLIENMTDISDQYNAYDSVVLYQMLQRVYAPEICINQKADDLKIVAINSFESMMAVFGTHTNLDEILAFIDFILDPCFFESDLVIVVEDVVRTIIKTNKKQWIIQRKVMNNLTKCLTQYPERILLFKIIIFKIIKGSEARGYDTTVVLNKSEQYVPLANKVKDKIGCKGEFHGAYPRFLFYNLLFTLSQKEENIKIIIEFVKYIVDQGGLERYKNGYMQYTKSFRLKLHLWQCIVSLKHIFRPEIFLKYQTEQSLKKFEESIWVSFDQLNNPQYRQYMEMMISFLFEQYPHIWGPRLLKTLSDPQIKVNIQISVVFISCVFINHLPDHELSHKIFQKIFPMVSSNVAYIRSLCQASSLKYITSRHLKEDPYFQEFVNYFSANRECKKIIKNIDALLARYDSLLQTFDLDGIQAIQFDTFGEIIHPSIIDILKSTCIQTIGELKYEDGFDEGLPPAWHQYIERQNIQRKPQEGQINFQRKIDFIMEQFDLFKAFKPRSVFGNIIVVATLLEKIPNFGHLTRTCEIFGCKELVIPNKKILQDESFQAVSVSAEHHLPISEVKEEYLMNFLLLKKQQGYSLVALEQTSQSKGIKDFKFQEKTVLLLGREKTGVPLEYIELMDACVEIPQYGVIRSLNVHISAVICVWQYVQQFGK